MGKFSSLGMRSAPVSSVTCLSLIRPSSKALPALIDGFTERSRVETVRRHRPPDQASVSNQLKHPWRILPSPFDFSKERRLGLRLLLTAMADPLLVHPGKLHYFAREILKRLRVPPKDASKIADVLVAADRAGVESQGVMRLPFFADRLSARLVNPTPSLKVVEETDGTITLDGDNGPGPVVGTRAMELAIKKAGQNGVAAVAVRNSYFLHHRQRLGDLASRRWPPSGCGSPVPRDRPEKHRPCGNRPPWDRNK